ncbi:MAG: hypothetical protein JWM80_4120, partial [Cyanobacteria bacterium RYN_339]|nr:hypothetical protein [Cyanobacteria bacterium RYN_339]
PPRSRNPPPWLPSRCPPRASATTTAAKNYKNGPPVSRGPVRVSAYFLSAKAAKVSPISLSVASVFL